MKKTVQFIVWIMIPFSTVAQSAAWKAKVDPVVLKKAQENATFEFVAVLKQQADVSAADNLDTKEEKAMFVYNSLKAAADHSQAEIPTLLTKANATFHPVWVVNCVVVTADAKTLEDVANLASVESIIENAKYVTQKTTTTEAKPSEVNAIEWGISKTKADQVWALGVKGAGVVIAGEDTGYDWEHAAIKKQYRGWDGTTADHNYNWHDAAHSGGGSCGANSKEPCDDGSHGTHTMGTMVGEAGTNQIGMAPGAKWIGCRNMNVGVGTLQSYIECFQFFLAPTDLSDKNADPLKSPHVINNSWGCPTDEGCNSSNFATMETVVNNLRAAGVVVVVSAGNDGSKGCSSINTPAAIYAGSFTVGSTTSTDAISGFSSLGPVTNFGTRVSPDISAPGSNVRSCVPGGGYSSMSGTSMAGPHVAGLVGLVISANPGLAGKVAKIEEIIQKTAVKLSSSNCSSTAGVYPNNTFGHGRIDALAAVNEAIKLLGVKDNGKTLTSVIAYPNPFSESINFEFKNCKPGTTLEVYAITGEKVLSKIWEATPSNYELNLSTYASGAYFYRLTNGAEHVNGKLFKVAQ
jgi:subtilisin family serine protease